MELEGCLGVVMAVVWNDVEEGPYQVKRVTCHVRDLEYRADTLTDELGGGIYAFLLVLDEDGYLSCTRRLQNLGQLGDGLLEDMRRANIDFGYADHDRHIKREGDTKMLLAHAYQAVVGSDHE